MVLKIVELSLRQRALVLLAALVLLGVGAWSALRLPIDSVPDITNPQVLLNTAVPALAPEEIEKLVTLPIESQMAGLPGMIELRSLSRFGLSQVRMTFQDGVDLYRTRQLVSERLLSAAEKLPPGLQPRLAPISTALGEIFYYSVEFTPDTPNKPSTRFEQLQALKQIQEYLISSLLRATPGVAEVNTSGGYERQIVVMPDPERLASVGMAIGELAHRISENTQNVGGGLVEIGGEQIVIRGHRGENVPPDGVHGHLRAGWVARAGAHAHAGALLLLFARQNPRRRQLAGALLKSVLHDATRVCISFPLVGRGRGAGVVRFVVVGIHAAGS